MKQLTIWIMMTAISTALTAQSSIIEMQSEHLTNPIGIDAAQPRLSWQWYDGPISGKRKGASWGWWIKNEATTLYENWPIDSKSDISMNHIMFGETGAWFYKGLGGIFPDSAQPGFRHIILRPNMVAALSSFDATHEGPFGMIRSAWTRPGGRLVYSATIPPGSTASLTLVGPGDSRPQLEILAAGRYSFQFDKKQKKFIKVVKTGD